MYLGLPCHQDVQKRPDAETGGETVGLLSYEATNVYSNKAAVVM